MGKIFITQYDYDRLVKLLRKKKPLDDFDKALQYELTRGEVVDPKDIPPNVITMNSHVEFIDEHHTLWDFWVVFPEDADFEHRKISILSPIGCALLGYKVGDNVTLHTPLQGRRDLEVRKILSQPEREGKFDL